MDLVRIEAALRAGPADEPRYVPGSFRASRPPRRWRTAFLAATSAVVIVASILLGFGLGALRGQPTTGGPSGATTGLTGGSWVSQGITRDAWVRYLLEHGHQQVDIDTFLAHDPIAREVDYVLTFTGDHLLVSTEVDGGPVEPLGGGPYTVSDGSTIRYDDVGCIVTVDYDVIDDWLTFGTPGFDGCSADERIANTMFFNPWPYQRRATP